MTLDDKRQVIEVLLCAGDEYGGLISVKDAVGVTADMLWEMVALDPNRDGTAYEDDALEAAYRLIGSSEILRWEWFGR